MIAIRLDILLVFTTIFLIGLAIKYIVIIKKREKCQHKEWFLLKKCKNCGMLHKQIDEDLNKVYQDEG